MKIKLYLFISCIAWLTCGNAQNQINKYEYWFDSNYTQKVSNTVTPGETVNLETSISASGLKAGIHSFNVRFGDSKNVWSAPVIRYFSKSADQTISPVNAMQYWFDGDFAAKVDSSFSPQNSLVITRLLSANKLGVGVHSVQIRFKDVNGVWSAPFSHYFVKVSPNSAQQKINITKYQYWFDSLISAKVEQTITPADNLTFSANLATSNLVSGIHSLQIRFQDENGLWSVPATQFFLKSPDNSISSVAKLKKYQYWFDSNFAAKIEESITPGDEFILTKDFSANSLSTGIHSVQVRFQDENGVWSVPTTQYFRKSPAYDETTNRIVSYEYWFDELFLTRTEKSIVETSLVLNFAESINTGSLAKGQHTVSVRFKDAHNQWTPTSKASFYRNDVSVDAKENLSAPELKLYPNPVTNTLFINYGKIEGSVSFEIQDLYGKVVFRQDNFRNESLDVSGLPRGVFLYRFIQENKTIKVGKIVLRSGR